MIPSYHPQIEALTPYPSCRSDGEQLIPLMASLDSTFLLVISSSLFFFIVVTPLARVSSSSGFVAHRCSNQVIRSTGAASFFENGLRGVFSDLVSVASRSEIHHSSSGGLGDDDHILASFHCWRDTPPQICKQCVESATKEIRQRCRNHIGAIVWHEECTLHYVSSQGILQLSSKQAEAGDHEEPPWTWWHNISCGPKLADQKANFNETMASVMGSLIDDATGSGVPALTPKLYATDEVMVTVLETLYGVVECGPTESYDTCRKCLSFGLDKLIGGCGGSAVAKVLLPSCWMGYDLGPSTNDLTFENQLSSLLSSSVRAS